IANPQVPEVGERYLGTVVKTMSFGAFVSLTPGKDGLLHISELRKLNDGKRVEDVDDVVGVGQKVQVEITKIEDRKSTRLNSSHVSISYAVFCLKKKNEAQKVQDMISKNEERQRIELNDSSDS